MDPAALSSLTPEQKQAVMAQAQAQANQQIMASMVESMTVRCFDKCVGTSVSNDGESWSLHVYHLNVLAGRLCFDRDTRI